MVWEKKNKEENNLNKMNNNLVINYLKKTLIGKLSYKYKFLIRKNDYLTIKYFYWLYRSSYERKTAGICIKRCKKLFNNMEHFILYFKYKNVKINQLYFNNSPFNTELLNKKIRTKSQIRFFIL